MSWIQVLSRCSMTTLNRWKVPPTKAVTLITNCVRSTKPKVMFSQVSVCSTPGGGGVTPARSRWGVGVLRPGPRGGGVCSARSWWGWYPNLVQTGGTQLGTPWPGQDGGYPGMGVTPQPGMYPPRNKTADGVLHTLRLVCLLRSRRRTFLLFNVNWP